VKAIGLQFYAIMIENGNDYAMYKNIEFSLKVFYLVSLVVTTLLFKLALNYLVAQASYVFWF
jgi:hypothetical protein